MTRSGLNSREVAGLAELGDGPRFATNGSRVTNFHGTVEVVAKKMAEHTVHEWIVVLSTARIPWLPPRRCTRPSPPQLAERKLAVTVHIVADPGKRRRGAGMEVPLRAHREGAHETG